MWGSGSVPMGADNDPRAPWNEVDNDEWVDVFESDEYDPCDE